MKAVLNSPVNRYFQMQNDRSIEWIVPYRFSGGDLITLLLFSLGLCSVVFVVPGILVLIITAILPLEVGKGIDAFRIGLQCGALLFAGCAFLAITRTWEFRKRLRVDQDGIHVSSLWKDSVPWNQIRNPHVSSDDHGRKYFRFEIVTEEYEEPLAMDYLLAENLDSAQLDTLLAQLETVTG